MLAQLQALVPVPWLAVVLAVVAGAGGRALAVLAARRTVRQPLTMALTEEVRLLGSLLLQPSRLPYLTPITAPDFAAAAHQRIWAALVQACPEVGAVAEDATDEQCAQVGKVLEGRRVEILQLVRETLSGGIAPGGDLERLDWLLERGSQDVLDDATAMEVAESVLGAGQDRNRLSGTGLVLPTALPDSVEPDRPPLKRVFVAPSAPRIVATSVLGAAGAALAPGLTGAFGLTGFAHALATAAVLVLLGMSLLISLVDLDTFYIDQKPFWGLTSLAWLLAAGAAALDGSLMRLAAGLGLVVAAGVVFEVVNIGHRLVRGTDGQGLGDTMLLLATAGLPVALTGEWSLGYYSVMSGMVLGLFGWLYGAARGRLTRKSPFAFGPYLAAGWATAWVGVALFGG